MKERRDIMNLHSERMCSWVSIESLHKGQMEGLEKPLRWETSVIGSFPQIACQIVVLYNWGIKGAQSHVGPVYTREGWTKELISMLGSQFCRSQTRPNTLVYLVYQSLQNINYHIQVTCDELTSEVPDSVCEIIHNRETKVRKNMLRNPQPIRKMIT